MKQKYTIFRDKSNKILKISESAELYKDMFTPIVTKTFPSEVMEVAVVQGETAVMSAFRSGNFFPPEEVAEKITHAILTVYETGGTDSFDVYVSDLDSIDENEEEEIELIEDLDDDDTDSESDELDGLLEDDNKIKMAKTPLKVAEGDPIDIEGDV
ncbi:hypothetical protein QUF75_15595 [Desulfococcaceae bacterium HSG7]|nr:hypothetical protein [Desulfococcaceae bacterium HSG7]